MAKVVYTVSQRAPARLHVEADITPDAPASVLTLRDTYGPAGGFAAGVANLAVTGADARAAAEPGPHPGGGGAALQPCL
ncbi:MAG: hypothetical protein HC900_03000 [Methylacidiphilales bacterium]|nr:hypothetical protein [Candidatus Methylacidiphilales bacterium]